MLLPIFLSLSENLKVFFTLLGSTMVTFGFFLLSLAHLISFMVENLNEVLYLLFLQLMDGVTSSFSCIWTNEHF